MQSKINAGIFSKRQYDNLCPCKTEDYSSSLLGPILFLHMCLGTIETMVETLLEQGNTAILRL